MAVPLAQDALVAEADASSARVERAFSVFEYAPRRPMPSTTKARWAIIALHSRLTPVPQNRRPSHVPTMHRRSRAENSESPVMPAAPCSRWTTRRSSCSPRSRWPARRSTYARGCSTLVYGPHENQRVTSGSRASARRAGASSAEGGRSVSVGPCSAMLALLYDIHGNLPALEAVLDDAAGRGVDRWLLGGDMAPFGAWPAETVQRLRDLENAKWIRGNTERWMVDPIPAVEPMAVAVQAARDALGYAVADELGALPESAALGDTVRAWHGSPVSDMRSFLPEPGEDEAELLIGVTDSRLYFGHTHLQFRRTAAGPNGEVELVNPGSIGIPLDGDHRAAYALVGDDGAIEFRRVEYDRRPRRTRCASATATPSGSGSSPGGSSAAKLAPG